MKVQVLAARCPAVAGLCRCRCWLRVPGPGLGASERFPAQLRTSAWSPGLEVKDPWLVAPAKSTALPLTGLPQGAAGSLGWPVGFTCQPTPGKVPRVPRESSEVSDWGQGQWWDTSRCPGHKPRSQAHLATAGLGSTLSTCRTPSFWYLLPDPEKRSAMMCKRRKKIPLLYL